MTKLIIKFLYVFFFSPLKMENKVKNFEEIKQAVLDIWELTDKNIKSITFNQYNNKAKVIPNKYSNNYEISLDLAKVCSYVYRFINILIFIFTIILNFTYFI